VNSPYSLTQKKLVHFTPFFLFLIVRAHMISWCLPCVYKLHMYLFDTGQPPLGVFVVARVFGHVGRLEIPRSERGRGRPAVHQRPNPSVAQQRGERDRRSVRLAEVDFDQRGAANLAANLRGTRQRGHYHLSLAGRRVGGEGYCVKTRVVVVVAICNKKEKGVNQSRVVLYRWKESEYPCTTP